MMDGEREQVEYHGNSRANAHALHGYPAYVLTRPEFFCSMHEPA